MIDRKSSTPRTVGVADRFKSPLGPGPIIREKWGLM